jgi:hypothetical protein
MTETNMNPYYREEDEPRPVNFGIESLFDGLVEIFVPYGGETEVILDLEEQFK